MVHVGAVRQTAQITWMSTEALRTGDKAIVNFKFVKTPEWIQTGRRFVFREGRTKAVSLKGRGSSIKFLGTIKCWRNWDPDVTWYLFRLARW